MIVVLVLEQTLLLRQSDVKLPILYSVVVMVEVVEYDYVQETLLCQTVASSLELSKECNPSKVFKFALGVLESVLSFVVMCHESAIQTTACKCMQSMSTLTVFVKS